MSLIDALERWDGEQLVLARDLPTDFVPALPGEEQRHLFIGLFGQARFFQFDPYAQALSMIVRAHACDVEDPRALVRAGLVDPGKLLALVRAVTDEQFARYPWLDRAAVESAVEEFVAACP